MSCLWFISRHWALCFTPGVRALYLQLSAPSMSDSCLSAHECAICVWRSSFQASSLKPQASSLKPPQSVVSHTQPVLQSPGPWPTPGWSCFLVPPVPALPASWFLPFQLFLVPGEACGCYSIPWICLSCPTGTPSCLAVRRKCSL